MPICNEDTISKIARELNNRRRWMAGRQLENSSHAISAPHGLADEGSLRPGETPYSMEERTHASAASTASAASAAAMAPVPPSSRCEICLDEPCESVQLDCGHVFCEACLKSCLAEPSFTLIDCPVCGARSRGHRNLLNIRAVLAPKLEELAPPACIDDELDIVSIERHILSLTRRRTLAQKALTDSQGSVEAFRTLTAAFNKSVEKINALIAGLQTQRDSMALEYKQARLRCDKQLTRSCALQDLISSLEGEAARARVRITRIRKLFPDSNQ